MTDNQKFYCNRSSIYDVTVATQDPLTGKEEYKPYYYFPEGNLFTAEGDTLVRVHDKDLLKKLKEHISMTFPFSGVS